MQCVSPFLNHLLSSLIMTYVLCMFKKNLYSTIRGDDMAISMAILSGIVVSVMMVFNGQLSDLIDLYTATVLIHACGLLTMYIVLKVKHISLRDLPHASRFLYLGGVIGVFTVFFNNLTITILGASMISALGLCGQMLTSIILEQSGALGTKKQKLQPIKLVSLLIILIGIGVMLE